MECRTPLYELVPHPKPPKTNNSITSSPSWSSARTGGHRPSPTTSNRYHSTYHNEVEPPPQPPMKRRLALPKNVVLLSLIQATELASKDARQKYDESPRRSGDSDEALPGPHNPLLLTPGVNRSTVANIATGPSMPDLKSRGSMLDMDDDEEEEEEKIKISTSLAVGKAGTYAVACRDGLQIFPSRPSSLHGSTENVMQEEDVESIVRVYHIDQANSSREDEENHNIDTNAIDNNNINASSMSSPPPPPPPLTISERLRNKKDPVKLRYGDRIQVVSVDGGWAKLARGYGFVRAEKNHIVKGTSVVEIHCDGGNMWSKKR